MESTRIVVGILVFACGIGILIASFLWISNSLLYGWPGMLIRACTAAIMIVFGLWLIWDAIRWDIS